MEIGIMLPFFGTTIGAACVLFINNKLNERVRKCLLGFAAGVMVAASVWSLILPAFEQCEDMGGWSVIPVVSGFWVGVLFLWVLDRVLSGWDSGSCLGLSKNNPLAGKEASKEASKEAGKGSAKKAPKQSAKQATLGEKLRRSKSLMLVLAVTLHNIPEGMAVGVAFAGVLKGSAGITLMGAMALSVGIAIQNFPEGAIVSLPLKSEGMHKGKAFLYGTLSGIVEPVASVLTLAASELIVPALPFLLCFAAGAMMYVVVEELIPEMASEEKASEQILKPNTQLPSLGPIIFSVGFTLMLVLDVVVG